MTIISQVSPHLFLNDALGNADLEGSRLCQAAMTTLQYITDQGGIGLTRSGAFNRHFVVWAVDAFAWPGYTAKELYVVNKVLNEQDALPLLYLHELLLNAKLIRNTKREAVLTNSGRSLVSRYGQLQVKLFDVFFTRFDFAAHERWPIEMPDADLLHFLGVAQNRLADWVAYPEFASWCLPIFALPSQRVTPEENAMFYVAARLVRPLEWLGLIEQSPGPRLRPLATISLRKTELFDKFIRIERFGHSIGAQRPH